jgi:hypothetical protein
MGLDFRKLDGSVRWSAFRCAWDRAVLAEPNRITQILSALIASLRNLFRYLSPKHDLVVFDQRTEIKRSTIERYRAVGAVNASGLQASAHDAMVPALGMPRSYV